MKTKEAFMDMREEEAQGIPMYFSPPKENTVKMLTPPMIFWDQVTVQQWNKLTHTEQDTLVKSAQIIQNLK